MQSLPGKKIIRSLLLGGTATAALVSANPAFAVTATQPVITSVVGTSTSCTVNFTTSVTGTVQDFGGDRYIDGAGTSSSPTINITGRTVQVGQTVALTSAQIISVNFVTAPLHVGIWETTSTAPTGVVAVTLVPRLLLQAAGGRCLNAIFNNPPVANAGADITATPSTLTTLTGAASSDADGDPITYQWLQTSGPAVTLNGATTVSPNFTAPAAINQIRTLIFRLIVSDGSASSGADTVAVTIPAGPNTLPVANAGPDANIVSGAPRTLAGTATDLDNDPLTYAWTQTAGPVVTITNANTANASFGAPVRTGVAQLLTFSLVANDGFGNSAADTVTLTVPANRLPTANAGADATINAGSTRALTGSATDLDGDALTYQWVQTAGPLVTIVNPTSANASFVAPVSTGAVQALTFSLVANDGLGNSPADTVIFTIPANSPPTVNAGLDQTRPAGSAVALAGTATDPETNPLTYLWTQTSGPVVTLTGSTTLAPGFTAPPKTGVPQILTFSFVANDGTSNSAPDTVNITIPGNVGPTANAGTNLVAAGGSAVNLNGGGSSDGDGDPITYSWVQTGGPGVTLNGANTANPSFTAPPRTNAAQVLTFDLTVNDGIASSATSTVTITVPSNVGPTVNAGADVAAAGGSQVSLAGSAADGDGDPVSFIWTQVAGPSVALAGSTTANPSFTAPPRTNAAQTLSFQLIGFDGTANSAPDTVDITIPSNVAPLANAGADATVTGSSNASLNGTASSDPDGDPLTFAWTQTSGPLATLTGASSATPAFVAPAKTGAIQLMSFLLNVSDGVATANDTVDISIAANVGPTANAGSTAAVNGGATVLLNGAASTDGDGDTLTYSWVQIGGAAVTLSGANTATPSFVAPAATGSIQNLTFALTVSDGVATSAASVAIDINANQPPVANAGVDQGPINTGTMVTLNGGASTDPDGNPLTYSWTQVSGPAATLSSATSANPTFVAPNVNGTQNLVFQLVVNDGTVNSPPDTVTIAVRAVGTVTVIQRVVGADGSFNYTSSIAALSGAIATSNGSGQRSANLVPAGTYSLSVADARAAGYAVTSISCNDTDSAINLSNRSVAITLSPNENLVCTFTSTNTRDAATVAISNFLTARNAAVLANRPDLQRRLDRLENVPASGGSVSAYSVPVPGSGKLPFSATLANGQAKFATSLAMTRSVTEGADRGSSPVDIWAEAYFATLNYPGHKGRFSIIHAGTDYRVSDEALVGVAAQFDRYSPKGGMTAGTVKGNGWMVGPYATFKLGPQFYADVRAAWGKSDNKVSPLGTFVDAFDTNRVLVSGSLIGQFDVGTATQFRPEVSVRYLDEKQHGYTDSLGVVIPGQKVGQGDLSFRPRLHHTVDIGKGWSLRPYAEAEGIYTFGADSATVLTSDFRMRIEGGADLFSIGNVRAGVSAFHDGIGGSGYKSSGFHLTFSLGF